MRNDHHGKNNKLVKRAFALCLALAVICSCLLPVFATEGGWIATQELDASTQVATMDTAFGVDDGYGIDTQETDAAASTSQSGAVAAQPGISTGGGIVATDPVVDGGSTSDSTSSGSPSESTASSTTGTSEVITDPSTITDVKIPDGATNIVKNANGSYSYTTEYGRVTVFPDAKNTDVSNPTIVRDDDRLKQDDAAFGVLPIEYHFWLKQLDSDTFRELDWEAQMAEMSETEYLALFGASEKFPIWHMDTIASTDTISNYKFANPTSKDDPAGEGREFAYWYTVDENGVESEFNPYKTYGSETATVVNVYAKWKDASGDVVNEDTTKEETTTSGETKTSTVEVSAKANIPDYNGEVTVTVTGLPSNVTHLSVASMGENSMQSFYELYSSKNPNSTMAPLLGYKIAPKDAEGNTVQPKGTVTVTISGLPEEIMLSELAPFKVLHQVTDYDIETINASYSNGTLTFATDSFSPFVIASKNGYAVTTQELSGSMTVNAGCAPIQLTGTGNYDNCDYIGEWSSSNPSIASVDQNGLVTVYTKGTDTVVISHTYCAGYWWYSHHYYTESITLNISGGTGAWVYLYVQVTGDTTGLVGHTNKGDSTVWYTIGRLWVPNLPTAASATGTPTQIHYKYTDSTSTDDTNEKTYWNYIMQALGETGSAVDRNTIINNRNGSINIDTTQKDKACVIWNGENCGLIKSSGANDYDPTASAMQWHLDGTIDADSVSAYIVNYYKVGTTDKLQNSVMNSATVGTVIDLNTMPELVPDEIEKDGIVYKLISSNPSNKTITIVKDKYNKINIINLYYDVQTAGVTVSKTVTGKLGDTNKDFEFTIRVNGVLWDVEASDYEVNDGGTAKYLKGGKFSLRNGDFITFKNIPNGAKVTVTETAYDHYTPSWSINDGRVTSTELNAYTATIDKTSATEDVIDFINTCDLKPDLGVLLDTLPYIVILAVVAGGGVLLMLRKRRKSDD